MDQFEMILLGQDHAFQLHHFGLAKRLDVESLDFPGALDNFKGHQEAMVAPKRFSRPYLGRSSTLLTQSSSRSVEPWSVMGILRKRRSFTNSLGPPQHPLGSSCCFKAYDHEIYQFGRHNAD